MKIVSKILMLFLFIALLTPTEVSSQMNGETVLDIDDDKEPPKEECPWWHLFCD